MMIAILHGAIRAGAWAGSTTWKATKAVGRRVAGKGSILHHMWDADAAQRVSSQQKRQRSRARQRDRQKIRAARRETRSATRDARRQAQAPSTAGQQAYASRLAARTGQPAPVFDGWTFEEASAEIDRLGGVQLQQQRAQQRGRIAADREQLATARTGRPAAFAGGGAEHHMQQMRELRVEYQEIAAQDPHDPRLRGIHDELTQLDGERQRLRDEAATEIWELEHQAAALPPTSSEYLYVLEQIDTLDAQREILSVHNQ